MNDTAADDRGIEEVTQWLLGWRNGDDAARERLFAWMYPYAKAIVARRLAGARNTDLSTTQLTHDTLLRLLERPSLYVHREHFLKVFAIAARQQLLDHVRAAQSAKRGGDWDRVDTTVAGDIAATSTDGYESLYRALDILERSDARKCRVVEMHHLLGFERTEVARLIGVSVPTVDRDLAFARAWLKAQLAEPPS
jgi:RNA polymerase sigma factor (TIGR02999 family)